MWSASLPRVPAMCPSSSLKLPGSVPVSRRVRPHHPPLKNPPHISHSQKLSGFLSSRCSTNSSAEHHYISHTPQAPHNGHNRLFSSSTPPQSDDPVAENSSYDDFSGGFTRSPDTPPTATKSAAQFFQDSSASLLSYITEDPIPSARINAYRAKLLYEVREVDPLVSVLKNETYGDEIHNIAKRIYQETMNNVRNEVAQVVLEPEVLQSEPGDEKMNASGKQATWLYPSNSRLGILERDPATLYCPAASFPHIRNSGHECLNSHRLSLHRDLLYFIHKFRDIDIVHPTAQMVFGSHTGKEVTHLDDKYIDWLSNKNLLYKKPRLRHLLALMGRLECLLPFEYPYLRPCPLRSYKQLEGKAIDDVEEDGPLFHGPNPVQSKPGQKKGSRKELWNLLTLRKIGESLNPTIIMDDDMNVADVPIVRQALSVVENESEEDTETASTFKINLALGKPIFWGIGESHVPRTFIKFHARYTLMLRLFRTQNDALREERKVKYNAGAVNELIHDKMERARVGKQSKKDAARLSKARKRGMDISQLAQLEAAASSEAVSQPSTHRTNRTKERAVHDLEEVLLMSSEAFLNSRRGIVDVKMFQVSSMLRRCVAPRDDDHEYKVLLAIALRIEHWDEVVRCKAKGMTPPPLTDPAAFIPELEHVTSFNDATHSQICIDLLRNSMVYRLQGAAPAAARAFIATSDADVDKVVKKSTRGKRTVAKTVDDKALDGNSGASTATRGRKKTTQAQTTQTSIDTTLPSDNSTQPSDNSTLPSDNSALPSDLPVASDPSTWKTLSSGESEPRDGKVWSFALARSMHQIHLLEMASENVYSMLTHLHRKYATLKSLLTSRPLSPRVEACLKPYRTTSIQLPPNFVFLATISVSESGSRHQYDTRHVCQISALDGLNREFNVELHPRFPFSNLLRSTEYYTNHNFQRFWRSSISPTHGVLSFVSWLFNPALGRYRVNNHPIPRALREPIGDEFMYINDHDCRKASEKRISQHIDPEVAEAEVKTTPIDPFSLYSPTRAKPAVKKGRKPIQTLEEEEENADDLSVDMLMASVRDMKRKKQQAAKKKESGAHANTTNSSDASPEQQEDEYLWANGSEAESGAAVTRVYVGATRTTRVTATSAMQLPSDVAAVVMGFKTACLDASLDEDSTAVAEAPAPVRRFTGVGRTEDILSRCGAFTPRQRRHAGKLLPLPRFPLLGTIEAEYEEVLDQPATSEGAPEAKLARRGLEDTLDNDYYTSMFPADMKDGPQTISLMASRDTALKYTPFAKFDAQPIAEKMRAVDPENELLKKPVREPVFLFGYRVNFWSMSYLDRELRRINFDEQRDDYNELRRFLTNNQDRIEVLKDTHPELAANALRNLFMESGLFLIDLVEIMRKLFNIHEPQDSHAWTLHNIHAHLTEQDRPILCEDSLVHVHLLKEIFYADNLFGAFIRAEVDRIINMVHRSFLCTEKLAQFPPFPNLGRTTFASQEEFTDYMRKIAALDLQQAQTNFMEQASTMAPSIGTIRDAMEDLIKKRGGETYRQVLIREAEAREKPLTDAGGTDRAKTSRRATSIDFDAINKYF